MQTTNGTPQHCSIEVTSTDINWSIKKGVFYRFDNNLANSLYLKVYSNLVFQTRLPVNESGAYTQVCKGATQKFMWRWAPPWLSHNIYFKTLRNYQRKSAAQYVAVAFPT